MCFPARRIHGEIGASIGRRTDQQPNQFLGSARISALLPATIGIPQREATSFAAAILMSVIAVLRQSKGDGLRVNFSDAARADDSKR
jgi:hypothetical protein